MAMRFEENRRNRKLCHLNPFEFFDIRGSVPEKTKEKFALGFGFVPGAHERRHCQSSVRFSERRIKGHGTACGLHSFWHTGLGPCQPVVAQHDVRVGQSGAGQRVLGIERNRFL